MASTCGTTRRNGTPHGALKRCATAWEDHMVDLGKQMNTMAGNLHTTPNAYDTTDAQAKDAFARLQHGLADFGRS